MLAGERVCRDLGKVGAEVLAEAAPERCGVKRSLADEECDEREDECDGGASEGPAGGGGRVLSTVRRVASKSSWITQRLSSHFHLRLHIAHLA